jgi:hypothetical protein
MRWATLCVGCFAFAIGETAVGQPVPLPKTPPPEFVVVAGVDKEDKMIEVWAVPVAKGANQ